jgi:hypothetical protein
MSTILVIIFTILSALHDTGKRFVDHRPRFILRAIIVMLISFLDAPEVLQGDYISYISTFGFNTAIFYMLFDYLLNIFEGRKWNYVGGTSGFDLFFRWLGGWIPQLIFKIIFLTITINLQWILKFLVNTLFG